jgi:rhomboid domain-containing protein 1
MRRHEKPKTAVFLLLAELTRLDRLPPVTLAIIALNVVIYLELFQPFNLPLGKVCLSAAYILQYKQWLRLLLSPFFHGDDWHLYYNMISFSLKGRSLEQRFGTSYFAILLAVFTVACSGMYVAVQFAASKFFDDYHILDSCAVGFSGVIFALKVVTTHYLPNGSFSEFGGTVPVPSKYVYWFELVAISLMTPNVSFAGHLAGILVGLLYVYGPLEFVVRSLAGAERSFSGRRPRFYTTHANNNYYD